jgi:homospermidine synthase
MYIKGLNSQYNIKATCVVETGMNPGLISSFAKKGVRSIVKKTLTRLQESQKGDTEYKELLQAFTDGDYPAMAKGIGLRLIICSEHDTQIATNPPNVPFCNTWSNLGLIEEHLEPFQIGIGTHENVVPFENHDAMMFLTPNLFVAENIIGGKTKIASIYVDSLSDSNKPVFSYGYGRCISHGECVSLPRYFAGNNYSPTVYFSYKINPASDQTLEQSDDLALSSLMTNPNLITLNQTHNVTGYDNVGALLIYEDPFDKNEIKSWWSGTILNVDYVRNELKDNYFLPTTIQVMAGIFSALSYSIENPNKGILFCEELDDKYILEKAKKYLGVVYNGKTTLTMGIKLSELVQNGTGSTHINLV